MNLLNPGYPPIRQNGLSSWKSTFEKLLELSSDVQIVTAYASEDSILELIKIVDYTVLVDTDESDDLDVMEQEELINLIRLGE